MNNTEIIIHIYPYVKWFTKIISILFPDIKQLSVKSKL